MHFLITLVASVFVFGLALLFHEAGHFATAKKCGIQVNEFSIGMGPALFSRVHGGTRYSLRLLPIGGYVSMEGEDGEVDPDERPEGASGLPFGKVSIPRRVLVVAAGAVLHPGEGGRDGAPVFATLFLGKGAYGNVDLEDGTDVIIKQRGSAGSGDPLDQRSSVGWKSTYAAKILMPEFLVRVESGSACGGGVAGN